MTQGQMVDPEAIAREIIAAIQDLEDPIVPRVRVVRKRYSRQLQSADGNLVLAIARLLHVELEESWVALELIRHHKPALRLITPQHLEEFGRRLSSWGTVDAFAGYLAGPAWMRGQIDDELVLSWTRAESRWWRRAALVCTVVLNTPSHGGLGDVERTLAVCDRLIDDRDDMVVKAMSWALRKLVAHDPEALQDFMKRNDDRLAARVKREVRNKLSTGLKNPKAAAGRHLVSGEDSKT